MVRRRHSPSRVAAAVGGLVAFILAGLSLALHLWLAKSLLLPIVDQHGIEYVFVSASTGSLITITITVWGAMFAGHSLLRWAAERHAAQPPLFSARDTAYAWPFITFLVSAAMLLVALVPPVAGRFSVWLFLLVDLRWWWTALVVAWFVVRINTRLGGNWLTKLPHSPIFGYRWLPQLSLVGIALGLAVGGTPNLRFSGQTHGDEPKYVRYCENFYQGLGFDISALQPMADLPPDFRPRVWQNVTTLARMLPGELRSLVGDILLFIENPGRKFNRARTSGDLSILIGKDGGYYQLHTPGLSFLMFPAYYLDRTIADTASTGSAQWPARLWAVNTFFLGLYGVWILLLFRFVRACVDSPGVAWVTTAAIVLTLPVAAFPFQFYPEVAAGVFVVAVAHHVLFGQPGPLRSMFFGVLAGYLPWLHIRFTALVGVVLVAAVIMFRRELRAMLGFVAGAGVSLGAFALYAYRLTGSILPTAMYEAGPSDEVVFLWASVPRTSLAYLFDRDFGLFAHSPVYLLALAGCWWMLRRRPAIVLLCTALFAAVLVPSAGHSLVMGGTTPMRTIVSVLPFVAVPLAELLVHCGRLQLLRVVFALLLVLSVENALAYNLHHQKYIGALVDLSVSGWKVNLLFPVNSRIPWVESWANGGLLVLWIAVALLLLLAPAIWELPRRGDSRQTASSSHKPSRWTVSVPGSALATIFVFGLFATTVAAFTSTWIGGRYLVPSIEAAVRLTLLLEKLGHCALCLTTTDGRIMTGRLMNELDAMDPAVFVRRLATRAAGVAGVWNRQGAYVLFMNDSVYPEGRNFWTRGVESAELLVVPANARRMVLTYTCGIGGGTVRLRVRDQSFDRDVGSNTVHEEWVDLTDGERAVPVIIQAPSAVRPADIEPGLKDTRLLGCRVEISLY